MGFVTVALRRRPSTGAHVALTTEARERYSPRLSRSPLAGRVAGAEVLTLEVSEWLQHQLWCIIERA